jgi:hypothetical protein
MLESLEEMLTRPKWKLKLKWKIFFVKEFEKIYITIWSCMKRQDVLEVLPMLMPKKFMDQFVFIWGCEQCSKMVSQISLGSHYYLKDLKHIYYGCHGLPYGTKDQTLLIDNESVLHTMTSQWQFFLYSLDKRK